MLDITTEQLLIFLASFHYLDRGNIAINQSMVNEFITTIGFDHSILFDDVFTNSKLVGKPGEFKPFIVFEDVFI